MLFGHQNDDTNQPVQDAPAASDLSTPPVPQGDTTASGVNPLAVDPVTDASLPAVTDEAEETDSTASAPTIEPAEQPVAEIAPTDLPGSSLEAAAEPEAVPEPAVSEPSFAGAPAPVAAGSDELLTLKQQALSQLSPLVSQLEQSPEEKFRTTMMLIQSTDNQSLLKEAYDAAQSIPDEKARAQALLDVVNEINYFTQQKTN